ncbi:Protein jagunal-like protein [Bienertia sinuspersici]
MHQRRSRPSGTDGSDYSYRMVVDSRYTKVAKAKSRLSLLFLLQGLVLLGGVTPILLPVVKGEDINVFGLSPAILSSVSLLVGELGRRQSRSIFLKIYLVLSIVAMFLSVVSAMKTGILFEVIQSGVAYCWEIKRLQLIEAVHIIIDVLVKIFAATTTLSLIHNMSPPKKSS